MLENDNHANSKPGGLTDEQKDLALRKALISIYGLSGDPEVDARRLHAAEAYAARVAPRGWRRVVAAGREAMEFLVQRVNSLFALQSPTRSTSLIAAGVVVGVTVLVTALAVLQTEGTLASKDDGIVWRGAAGGQNSIEVERPKETLERLTEKLGAISCPITADEVNDGYYVTVDATQTECAKLLSTTLGGKISIEPNGRIAFRIRHKRD